MDSRTAMAHKFRTRLGFTQYNVILTKEQSVLTKVMKGKHNMQTCKQYAKYAFTI